MIAIGDIHGHSNALAKLLNLIEPNECHTIVTLGDCVNRGPDTRGVLEQLIKLRETCNLICVLGNHEETMLEARKNYYARSRWEEMGGFETLMSYGSEGHIADIPKSHWCFLETFVPYHETDNFIFVHANYNWYTPMDEQPASLLRWTGLDDAPPKQHVSGKKVICGHSPGPVRDLGFCLCIDTGCGFGGPLTAANLLTGQYWSISQ